MVRKLAELLSTAAAVVMLVTPALAQGGKEPPQMTPEQKAEMEAYMKAATPGAQHEWLASTAGNYTLKIKSWNEPGGPAMEEAGTATRKMMLDGRVIAEDVNSTMMGTPFTGHGLMGFDNVTGKYWSTWTDSMSTGIMVNEGSCDAKKTCTFTGPGKDGKEMKMMEITYTKV